MSEQLIESLKNVLKSKGISYKDLSQELLLSEATIKRLFSKGGFSLDRFLEICSIVDISPSSLFELVDKQSTYEYEYTEEQEHFFVKNPKCLAFFDFLLKGKETKQIAKEQKLTISDIQKTLKKLEGIGLIEWLPKDKVKLTTSKNVCWRKNGPLRRHLLPMAKNEFLQGAFDTAKSDSRFMITDLSEKSLKKLEVRIQELINEVSQESNIDFLAKSKREPIGLFLAYRPWNFSMLEKAK